jgi:Fe-S cluster assembly iron-binding protein IscA
MTEEASGSMLTITPRALAVMRRVTAHPRLTSTSGLRIARGEEPSLPMRVGAVEGPHPDDRVLEQDGARLYLGPGADTQVEDGELDAVTDEDGRVQFILRSA